jgi:hypothetical protein
MYRALNLVLSQNRFRIKDIVVRRIEAAGQRASTVGEKGVFVTYGVAANVQADIVYCAVQQLNSSVLLQELPDFGALTPSGRASYDGTPCPACNTPTVANCRQLLHPAEPVINPSSGSSGFWPNPGVLVVSIIATVFVVGIIVVALVMRRKNSGGQTLDFSALQGSLNGGFSAADDPDTFGASGGADDDDDTGRGSVSKEPERARLVFSKDADHKPALKFTLPFSLDKSGKHPFGNDDDDDDEDERLLSA